MIGRFEVHLGRLMGFTETDRSSKSCISNPSSVWLKRVTHEYNDATLVIAIVLAFAVYLLQGLSTFGTINHLPTLVKNAHELL